MVIKSMIGGACACLALASLNVYSATYTSSAFDQGWYNSTGQGAFNTNYLVGDIGGTIYRDWFAFDLASINLLAGESIVGATLTVDKAAYIGNDVSKDWFLTSIESDINVLTTAHSAGSPGQGIFTDLADGLAYGVTTVVKAEAASQVIADLSGMNALADINASLGGLFAIGGYLSAVDLITGETLFSGSSAANMAVLTIETSVVPVPAAVWLFASGLFALIGVSRKR